MEIGIEISLVLFLLIVLLAGRLFWLESKVLGIEKELKVVGNQTDHNALVAKYEFNRMDSRWRATKALARLLGFERKETHEVSARWTKRK